jgi:hypothetical protein
MKESDRFIATIVVFVTAAPYMSQTSGHGRCVMTGVPDIDQVSKDWFAVRGWEPGRFLKI